MFLTTSMNLKKKHFCVIFGILDLPFYCRAGIQGVQLKRFTENFQRKFEKHVYMTPFSGKILILLET